MGGTTPQHRGRYLDFDVMAHREHWDPVTRELLEQRVEEVPPFRFFDPDERRTLGAFLDVTLAQVGEPRIPVLNMVDAKLFEGRFDGFVHDDMPRDDETWRRVAEGLDATAVQHGFERFHLAPAETQKRIVEAFHAGELHGRVWDELPCSKAWSVVMRGALSEFYSHPWTWNEIGFGGPAYPRGYAAMGAGAKEWWEKDAELDADPVVDTKERGLE